MVLCKSDLTQCLACRARHPGLHNQHLDIYSVYVWDSEAGFKLILICHPESFNIVNDFDVLPFHFLNIYSRSYIQF